MCYYVDEDDQHFNYDEAKQFCNDRGDKLLTIESQAIRDALLNATASGMFYRPTHTAMAALSLTFGVQMNMRLS